MTGVVWWEVEVADPAAWFGIIEDPCGIAFGLWTAALPASA